MPPMAYLREIRLKRVHAELSAAVPGLTSVTEVATRWGFVHLSRFASVYRAKFARTRPETLRGQ
jgi:transcriptional regulator GlxA family with amidase domain